MGQNTSSAVMQQRHEARDSLDYFPTPPWATRALCERLMQDDPLTSMTAWEPACGEGHMARPLGEYFAEVYASDVCDYGESYPLQTDICDFLCEWDHPSRFVAPPPDHVHQHRPADWIITNPPFRLAEDFIDVAVRRATRGAAFFVRSAFLEGGGRFERLFSLLPPSLILQFVERVPLLKGRLSATASSATSYCWIIWPVGPGGHGGATRFEWIAPCRKRLERAGDYPEEGEVLTSGPLFDGGPS